jgi:hypothetical protein
VNPEEVVMASQRSKPVPSNIQFEFLAIGEEYRDLAVVAARTLNTSPNSLIQGYLRQALDINRDRIMRRVEYAARRRGVSVEEMWDRIIRGDYDPEKDLEGFEEDVDVNAV